MGSHAQYRAPCVHRIEIAYYRRQYFYVAARKLAVSFDEDLAQAVDQAAKHATEGNVSAWLAAAARAQLRREAGRALLEELLAGQPPIAEAERQQIRREWPRG